MRVDVAPKNSMLGSLFFGALIALFFGLIINVAFFDYEFCRRDICFPAYISVTMAIIGLSLFLYMIAINYFSFVVILAFPSRIKILSNNIFNVDVKNFDVKKIHKADSYEWRGHSGFGIPLGIYRLRVFFHDHSLDIVSGLKAAEAKRVLDALAQITGIPQK